MKTQAKTGAANVPRGTSGIVTIETKAHIFRKGESNGFCEWFGCEMISVMGLVQGRNLIELHYGGKETVFFGFDAIERDFDGCYFCVDCPEMDTIVQIYKVARFVFNNFKGILSVKES